MYGAVFQQSISTRTFDATYHSAGLPNPDRPGATLDKELLQSALDHACANRELFLGRFELLGEAQRREGGQGIIQFAKVRLRAPASLGPPLRLPRMIEPWLRKITCTYVSYYLICCESL